MYTLGLPLGQSMASIEKFKVTTLHVQDKHSVEHALTSFVGNDWRESEERPPSTIKKLPHMLVLHQKRRFAFNLTNLVDWKEAWYTRFNNRVSFPIILDLSNWSTIASKRA